VVLKILAQLCVPVDQLATLLYSVPTLLLRNSIRFHDKKTLDSQKDTRLQKQTYTP